MKKLFNHLFYRVYWWNIKIIKERDVPVLSAFVLTAGMMGINLLSIFGLLVIGFNVQLFPDGGYIPLLILVSINNYFWFIHGKKYSVIINKSEKLNNVVKRKLDIIVISYLILSLSLFFLIVNILNHNRLK